MAPFGVGCGFMCFVALQFYVFCRAGGVGQLHQVLGTEAVFPRRYAWPSSCARGWMNQSREPVFSSNSCCRRALRAEKKKAAWLVPSVLRLLARKPCPKKAES